MSSSRAGNSTSAERLRLLRAVLTERGLTDASSSARSTNIQARSRTAVVPLSSTQRRMWFAQALFPEGTAYNMLVGLRIDGPLDLDSLRTSVIRLFGRHAILRTRYTHGPDGELIQLIEQTGDIALSVVDIDDKASATLEDAIAALAREIADRPFDLASDPPLRVELLRVSAHVHVLILVLHHIAADEITWDLLFADLSAQYAFETGQTGAAPAAPGLEYADYAVWEQQRLQHGHLDNQLKYWVDRLTPLPPTVGFPATTQSPESHATASGRYRHALPDSTVAGLRDLARIHKATPYTIVLAGLATVLHRYTEATDLVIGIPALVRDASEVEGVWGNFTNTLALRLNVDGQTTFLDLLGRARSAFFEAYDNRDIPFETVIERVAPQRTTGRSPLFEVMFAATRPVTSELSLAGTTTTDLGLPNPAPMFDLAIDLVDGAALAATFRTDKYAPEFIQQVLEHLATVLAHGVVNPECSVRDLPMLTDQQRQRILCDWNATGDTRHLVDIPLHTLFERQALQNPNAIAVVTEDGQLSYGELDVLAGQLVSSIRSLGIGSGSLVGINMDRSADLVVALLAVLKAGAAFVPLEPAWPASRIAEVCTNARLAAVLTHGDPATRLPSLEIPVLNLDEKPWDATNHNDPASGVQLSELAYVVFTSGSTGTPKGVMVTHAGICNRLLWQADVLGFGADDAALHKSSLGFDMGINEIFLPLVCGAAVVLPKVGAESDPAYLLELIARTGVTFIDLVPSLLDPMLDRPEFTEATRSLASVWTGGEALSPELLERFLTRCEIPMYHGYGPTEATVACTYEVYRAGSSRHGVTIGTPIANNQAFILDRFLRPVPPGVSGELYIGGVQLARGYVEDPARTAERFVADPVSGAPGARIYRTGDRARFLPNGTIEFLGRVDNQLKIRGRRIAPEEIENALTAHPAIRRAAVMAQGDRLVAYCACEDPALTWLQLRDWLRARLPEHLIPPAGTILDALPQLPSGKIDRAAVQRIPVEVSAAIVPYLEPRYAMERVLVDLWLAVLKVPRIGVDDNFFDIGGHSLLLARVQARLSEQLGLSVSLLDLYAHPTVAELATYLNGARDQGAKSEVSGSGGLVAARSRAERGRDARVQRLSQQRQRR
ncbi:non-ribosomal peptide synthetase [Mycobacteroides chelonae]|uniref:non-ribosomal peptide synthetase n=1 Tax=Mycobacteroides chelonae TaxID=1774 RepID=UPI001C2CC369|nr:non-ribosomal peptide synthetase [Mycobacteroides chelonae]MBV0920585.1 amino acid adenylation domain-containing protein [Mycobacteroides chelonae]